jgi:hypothetical protein
MCLETAAKTDWGLMKRAVVSFILFVGILGKEKGLLFSGIWDFMCSARFKKEKRAKGSLKKVFFFL